MTYLRFPCFAGLCLACLTVTSFAQNAPAKVFGYADFSQQAKWDAAFMAVPDAKLAGEHLRILT